MKKPSFLPGTLLLSLLVSFNTNAEGTGLNEFNQFTKNGQYSKALTALNNVDESALPNGQKFYLTAITNSKLQEFDNAIKNFELAIKANNNSADIYYEYGQALYAANELKASRKAFSQSVERKFNVPASMYYVAHISQILEEFITAKDSYTALLKNKEADTKMKQIARFQLAETLLSIMREKVKNPIELEKGVDKYIIAMMQQSYNADKSSPLAQDIIARIREIQKEFGLDPDLLKNGRRVSPKRYSGYFSQKIKFDDNISLTNEENNVQASKKESYIFETEVFSKRDFIFKKKFIVSPEVRINFSQHSDQDSPEVYQNDALAIYLNLKNRYEHTVKNQPAAFLLDFEFSNTMKDWNQKHKREAYAKSFNIGIGEAFSYFSFGDTSLKLKRKSYTGENEAISNTTYAISGDQTVSLANQNLLIALVELNLVDNFNNTSSNTNSLLARIDYLIPEIMPKYTLALALSTTVTDTLEQDAARGTEFTLNPSADLSKEINQKMKISINYDFTKSKSKQSDYSYSKNVFSTEFRYSF